ncbi:hypothetical protein D6825_01685 [Candidatus Woesearchaeota archaeon]|nr:MAG: hypothetical protein D6825_01685 [Candidatus Woesearchaeota archaeon]
MRKREKLTTLDNILCSFVPLYSFKACKENKLTLAEASEIEAYKITFYSLGALIAYRIHTVSQVQ